jgi:hypothetical protein
MSAIASHTRGLSYLNLSSRKKYYSNEAHGSKYKHIKAINIMLGKMRNWSKAYHLPVDFTSKRPDVHVEINSMITPAENKLYSFASGISCTIGINHSGMTLQSPFSFVNRIEIIREELYDDEYN